MWAELHSFSALFKEILFSNCLFNPLVLAEYRWGKDDNVHLSADLVLFSQHLCKPRFTHVSLGPRDDGNF